MKKQTVKAPIMILLGFENAPEIKWVECPKCKGEGELNGAKCSGCDGKGKVRA